jgi:hypothetical protein
VHLFSVPVAASEKAGLVSESFYHVLVLPYSHVVHLHLRPVFAPASPLGHDRSHYSWELALHSGVLYALWVWVLLNTESEALSCPPWN